MDELHQNQISEIHPYQYEPEPGSHEQQSESDSEEESSSQSDDSVDEEFEAINGWRNSTLSWCKCKRCSIVPKTVENFCSQEKAVEYDEYDAKLTECEQKGGTCITSLEEYSQNMLTEGVLKVDLSRYIEENWPLSDEELERKHKLFRLAAYQRCSRWIFGILGKKHRRPFPACIYSSIRNKFESPDGIYTCFKYPK